MTVASAPSASVPRNPNPLGAGADSGAATETTPSSAGAGRPSPGRIGHRGPHSARDDARGLVAQTAATGAD